MKVIPVCYCGNRGVFGGIFMSALSMMEYTDSPLQIILLTMDLSERNQKWLPFSEEQRALLDKTLKEKNPESSAVIYDVTSLQQKYFDGGCNQKNSYTPYASIRLFLDLLDVPEKLIYLDADVMCLSDINELYSTDVSDFELAASLDVVGHRFFPRRYCNSGVLLLNLKLIKETGLFEKARKKVRRRPMLMPDQSAINSFAKKKLVLPYRFNEQRDIKDDTVIKHFCMGYKWRGIFLTSYNYKQWHRDKVRDALGIHQLDTIYEKYDSILAQDKNKELIFI